MQYERIAQESFFYDFVFYETDKKNLYTYCPNCGCDKTTELKSIVPHGEKKRIQWVKKNHLPCTCFADVSYKPKYFHSRHECISANRVKELGEFCKNPDGSVSFNVYIYSASFAASEYNNSFGNPFYRDPIYDYRKTIEFKFCKGQKTQIFKGGIQLKNWQRRFTFGFIEQSIEQLKGTFLEEYTNDIYDFNEALSSAVNVPQSMGWYSLLFLFRLVECPALKKLWRAGYKRLCVDRILSSVFSSHCTRICIVYFSGTSYELNRTHSYTLNWQGKTLEKILKCSPQKLDLISERHELTFKEVEAARTLVALGIETTLMNVEIVMSTYFGQLEKLYGTTSFPISKMFKYIRHEKKKVVPACWGAHRELSFSEVVTDYYDYLENLKKLQTQFTKDVVFPTDLKTAHDRAAQAYQALNDQQKTGLFKKAMERFKTLSYENGEYEIFVVDTLKKLQTEAKRLHNCAGGYADRILGGLSVIFLIKSKTPRQPFYMLELNPKNLTIVQNRGMRNCSAPKEVREFAETWLRTVILPNSKIFSAA